MSGWTFEVTKRRVKERKTTVICHSEDEAIEFAKSRDKWDDPEIRTEYTARNVFTEDTPYYVRMIADLWARGEQ